MCCPLKSDNGVGAYKENVKLFKCVVKSVVKWWNNHPKANSHNSFGSPYALIAHNLFYESYEDWRIADNNLFGRTDWKKKLETYFNIQL